MKTLTFATARRCKPDHGLILRLKERGIGVQNIAQMTGFSMEDVRRVLTPAPANDDKATPEPWPFGPCSAQVETVIRTAAAQWPVTLSEIVSATARGSLACRARNALYDAVRRKCPGLTMIQLEGIFGRNQRCILNGAVRHAGQAGGQ